MRLFIIGSNGQLGWELSRRGDKQGFDVFARDLPDIDITNSSELAHHIKETNPGLVINTSAYTLVDQAESDAETAYAVNHNGSGYLAAACANNGVPLIHVSTDYVFDGEKKTPYLETDNVCPIGVYGKSKAGGEAVIRIRLKQHIIIRTAWLYGVHGHNFIKTMLRLGTERESIDVVSDQHGCPTFARDLADALLAIADRIRRGRNIAWGTYHYCGEGSTTWHGFAEVVFSMAAPYLNLAVKEVNPVPTEKYPTKAKRPKNSVLDCSLLKKHFGIQLKPWKESVQEMLEDFLGNDE